MLDQQQYGTQTCSLKTINVSDRDKTVGIFLSDPLGRFSPLRICSWFEPLIIHLGVWATNERRVSLNPVGAVKII